jgi:type IV pilus assembly protein PilW
MKKIFDSPRPEAHWKNGGQTGFTLVELMVSMAIGLFLAASIAGIYIAARKVFASTSAAISMDENARAAFDLIGASIRQASFDGCGSVNGAINGDTRGGALDHWWDHFAQPVSGLTLNAPDSRFAAAAAGSDVLILIGIDSRREASVVSDDPASATITTGPHTFKAGDVLLATDCNLNSYFVMTGGTSTTIVHDASGNCSAALGAACAGGAVVIAAPYTLPAGALILPMTADAWFVAPSGTAGKGNSLWNASAGGQFTESVNGVESIALQYGLDSDGDGSINGYVNAGAVNNWSQALAVKVRLLMATAPDSGANAVSSNAYAFNDRQITPADKRFYREYITVFALRNRNS